MGPKVSRPETRARRALVTAAVVGAGLLTAAIVVAQQTTDGSFILHEQLSDSQMSAAAGKANADRPFGPASDAPDGAPRRVPGQPPPLTTEASDEEPVYDAEGPVARDEVEAPHGPLNPFSAPNVLDDKTDRVNSLTYFANFDPSVIPLKRVVSQNQVVRVADGNYAVRVDPGQPKRVEVGGDAGPNDETFWGSFLLRTESKRWHPIATVSPTQRILEVRTEPAVDVEFRRDKAGNLLARTGHRGLIRLNMKVAVDSFFFRGDFDDTVLWEDFVGIDDAPQLDREIRRNALRVLREIGITRSSKPAEAIRKLVAHYRDFEAKPFPEELRTGDLFTSITVNQIGVCRHRSLSFIVAAHALGIPAHYVNNEAHAFVEIAWPGRGWRRIDLGGAADELNAAADSGRSLHSPGEDPLPRPDRYLREQDRMEQNGLSGDGEGGDGPGDEEGESSGDEEAAAANGETVPEPGQPPSAGEPGPSGDQAGDEAAGQTGEEASLPQEMLEAGPQELPPGTDAPDAEAMRYEMERQLRSAIAKENGQPERVKLAPTQLRIVRAVERVRRGAQIDVIGQLSGDSGPIRGAKVAAFLGPPGTRSVTGATRVGEGVTDSRGRVIVSVEVPKQQSTGRWSLFLVFQGNSTLAPAVAD